MGVNSFPGGLMKRIRLLRAEFKLDPTRLSDFLFPTLTETIRLTTIATVYAIPLSGFSLEGIASARAQSIIPAPDDTHTIIIPEGNRIDITGGQRSNDGANLFHSFTQFNLSSDQIANFLSQPDIQNILTRINGGEASLINGLIQVTGGNSNLLLMNPSGIIFGANSRLDVPASFLATTASGIGFGDRWFNAMGTNHYADLVGMPNSFAFTTNQPGAIFNAGNLAVGAGQTLALVGGTVVNIGQAIAPSGQITLASVPGERLVRFSQPGFVLGLMILPPASGENSPTQWTLPILSLPELLTGGNGENATEIIVNRDGSIQLTGSSIQLATNPGTTIVSGTVGAETVNASESTNQGGTIHILGDRVGLFNANINASGINGGGNVLIGGDNRGRGTVPNALRTFVSEDSTINADALSNGNGGNVIVWADETTRVYGNISVRGGQNAGNGGFVEISGLQFLDLTTTPDVSAASGSGGTWSIDPNDIEIIAGSGNTQIDITHPFESTDENTKIGIDLIVAALTGGAAITIKTGGSGNITLGTPLNFDRTGNNSLTLSAAGNININADIADSQPGGDSLNLNFEADSDNSGGGRLSFNNIVVNTEGGNLTGIARGNAQFPIGISIDNSILNTAGGNIELTGTSAATNNNRGIVLDSSTLNAGGGNLDLTGIGGDGNDSRGILLDNAAIATQGTGTITLEGTSGAGTDSHYGVLILNNSRIAAVNGDIRLSGTGNGTGTSTYGIWLRDDSLVEATGTGNIDLNGMNNATGRNNDGIAMTNGGGVVSGAGNITLSGTAGGGNGTDLNFGIIVGDAGSRVVSTNGTIELSGTGGGTGNNNYGIFLQNGGVVEAMGTGGVTLTGTGGAGTDSNDGIRIEGANSRVASVDGSLSLTGVGNGTGNSNRGVYLFDGGVVASTGRGNLTLTGTGSAGTDNNDGIRVEGANSRVSSVGGQIDLTGTGNGTGLSVNEGIDLFDSAVVESETGNITLTGMGANGAEGIRINGGAIDPTGTGSGTVTFVADEINLLDTPNSDPLAQTRIRGTGTLLLQPLTPSLGITIGGTFARSDGEPDPDARLNLDTDELNNLQGEFSQIAIGRTDGTGEITVDNATFDDPVTFESGGGSIAVNAPIAGTDNASITLNAATINLNSGITTTNQNITVGGNIWLGSDVTLSTGAGTGDITLGGTVDGLRQLRLDAGTGNVRLNAAVGGVTPVGSLEILNAETVFVAGGITTANSDLTFNLPVILAEDATFNTGTAKITFNRPISSEPGETHTLNLTAGDSIRTADIATNGGNIAIASNRGTVTTGTLEASSATGIGGTIALTSPTGAVTSRDLNARGVTGGGTVTVVSGDRINTGNIDISASNGEGGSVQLDPPNDVQVGFINAQGGTGGGTVEIATERFFRATNSFIDRNGRNSSISTAGGTDGGAITIRHGGGDLATPFIVGDAETNGTAAALTTGTDTLSPTRLFPGSFTLGNLQIITSDRFTSEISQSTVQRENPTSQNPMGDSPNVPIDSVVEALEEIFTRQYEAYLGQTTPTEISSLEAIRTRLSAAQQETGVTSALVYIAFGRGTGGLESLFSEPQTPLPKPGMEEQNLAAAISQVPTIDREAVGDRRDEDVLELVLVMAQGEPFRYRVSGATRSQVLAVIGQFQAELTDPSKADTTSYLAPAQQLYQWLIAPLAAELQAQAIEHLVFIPDVGLRTVPVAAFHNGEQFLIEQYSVSLMPSFSLTDPRPVNLKNASVLAMGASTFTHLRPLPAVPVELNTITPGLWQGQTAIDEAFTVENLQSLRDSRSDEIVHLATHAEFLPGRASNSYIQFWDSRLNLDDLQQLDWNDPPVELLVLSACRTAIGNEEVELGFAGLAVRTGVKSALASLWYVSDEGTLGLMAKFYDRLRTTPIRVEALQQAQVSLIRKAVRLEGGTLYGVGEEGIALPPELSQNLGNSDLSHPRYWAAFTAIGNPW
jgi:filamentous hemagglutinin family protein